MSRRAVVVALAALLAPPLLPVLAQSEALPVEWSVEPTWLGGTGRYDSGEWVWTDFPFDDYGADTGAVGQDNIVGLARTTGDFRYPDDPRYAHNTADVVMVRARPVDTGLEVQVTLNALVQSDAVALGVTLEHADPAAEPTPWPGDAGVSSRWEQFLYVTAADPSPEVEGATVVRPVVDLVANTLTFSVSGPLAQPARLVIGAGPTGTDGRWLAPDEFDSGHGRPTEVRLFDLAFNSHRDEPRGGPWREDAQAAALASGDVSAFAVRLDVAGMAVGRTDPVPAEPGFFTRVFRSRMDLGEGVDPTGFPQFRSPYQPYGLWIPGGYADRGPAGARFLLTLHSLEVHHNQYRGGDSPSASFATLYEQMGDELGALMATPLARGPDGWYWDEALVDTLEVWADVLAHYDVDRNRTSVQGYSMGGYGTYRLTTLLPDLFASAVSWAGPPAHTIWPFPLPPTPAGPRQEPGQTNTMLNGTLHVPTYIVHGTNDELVPVTGVTAQSLTYHQLGHPYRYALHPGQDHLSFVFVDEWSRAAEWHEGRKRVANPGQVTFTLRPSAWITPGGPDHLLPLIDSLLSEIGGDLRSAYWIDALVGADESADAVVDLTSAGIPLGEKAITEIHDVRPAPNTPHVLQGVAVHWSEIPTENRLSGTLANVGSLVVDADRAGLTRSGCLEVVVTSDRPTELVLRWVGHDDVMVKLEPGSPPAPLCFAVPE